MRKFTLKELAELTSSKLVGNSKTEISGINTLENANANEISFLANPKYKDLLKTSKAAAFCIDPSTVCLKEKKYLISNDPSRTFQTIAEILLNKKKSLFKGIHPTAVIDPSAKIGKNVSIGPQAVIEENVEIGEGSSIGALVYIGNSSKIGKNCQIHPHAVVREYCVLHDRVILQPGAVIGSCGFGYTMENHEWKKLEQLGSVILEDDVEIGANTTIDRARFTSTKIGKGTKIDNLVQIAHNVEIGKMNAIAAQTGIAGSAKIGNYVLMGGQVGIVGHIEIGEQVILATRAGVNRSLKSGKYRGSPVMDYSENNRIQVYIKNLPKLNKSVAELKNRLDSLEEQK